MSAQRLPAIRRTKTAQSCVWATRRRAATDSPDTALGESASATPRDHSSGVLASVMTLENPSSDRIGAPTTGRPLARYSCK